MKAIDLFCGVGGIRLGFKKAFKDNIKFVFSSELDKHASKTYTYNFNDTPAGDITKINESEIPNHDIILAGFPCQSFSIAGNRKGFDDTRGTLFFDIARIADHHKTEILFLENVKNLLTHDNGRTFKIIKDTLEDMGYNVFYSVLNAKDFDIPQNRERLYIVCFRNHNINFEFPKPSVRTKTIHDCLETEDVDSKYYYNDKAIFKHLKDVVNSTESIYQWRRSYVRENKNGICPALTANMGSGGNNVPLIFDGKGVRKLTPKETGLFQGFPKDFKAPEKMADCHLYKQFGNSVAVGVVNKIAEQIKKAIINKV